MAFSKGKRIEDETSTRIIDLAVNIGCKEGPDALTVTRICKELNCDRRVIYNRFRDVDEINFIVAGRCNEELIAQAKTSIAADTAFAERMQEFVKYAFTYVYERNAYFQYYTCLYQITQDGIQNEILNELAEMIEQGKKAGAVAEEKNSQEAAQSIWIIFSSISAILAKHVEYKYQEALRTLNFGIEGILKNLTM